MEPFPSEPLPEEGNVRTDNESATRPDRIALVAIVVGAGVGVAVFLGWLLDLPSLRTLFGLSNPMVPLTALGFVLSASALWLLIDPAAGRARRTAGIALAGVVAGLGAVKLGEHAFGWRLLDDPTISVRDPGAFPGQMAVPTALAFLLLGAAVMLLNLETKRGWRPAATLALLTAVLPLFSVVGRLYEVQEVQRFVTGTVVMAIHTAVTLLILCAGVVRSRPRQGLMLLFADTGRAGMLLRRFVPGSMLAVVAAGWLRLAGERAGLFRAEFGTNAFVIFTVSLLTALTLWTARGILRAEQETGAAEELHRSVFRSIGEAVAVTDLDGTIVSVNPAFERLTGWPDAVARGKPHEEVVHVLEESTENVPLARRLLIQALESGEVVASRGYDLLLVRRDGEPVPVSISAAPILSPNGEVVGGVGIMRDVSNEREVDQLKSSLVSTVSHELRTPLTMIQGFSELLLARLDADPATRSALEQINTSAERLGRIITDLLSVSRMESGKLEVRTEPMPLAQVLREALAPFAGQREVRLDMEENLVVLADRDKLLQIVTNLVSNAIKYSPDGAPVTVAVRSGDGAAQIAVRDEGIGMSRDEVAQLFEKFFRSESARVHATPGTGLGLFITKGLLEMQGGSIQVESEPGAGTTFTCSLPLAEMPSPEMAKEPAGVGADGPMVREKEVSREEATDRR